MTAAPWAGPALGSTQFRSHPDSRPSTRPTTIPTQSSNRLDPAGVDRHLDQVAGLLQEAMTELAGLWSGHLADQPALAILGDQGLPSFLGGLLDGGGKRIRPTMAYLGWLAASPSPTSRRGRDEVVRVGAALELLHVFGLVHDDVMDESATRRGRPTVHVTARRLHGATGSIGSAARFGDTVAILVGDLAHAEADALAADLPPGMRRIWRELVVELTCGQLLDVIGAASRQRDATYASRAAIMKSGRYTVERPLQLGAAAVSAPPAVCAALAGYGREIGQAFALRDDVLGIWGDPETTGKPAGDDLISGKPTMLLTLADQRLRGPAARARLNRVGTAGFTTADVVALQDELRAAGVGEVVEAMISAHVEAASDALRSAPLHPTAVVALTGLAAEIAWRDK